ncbi:MAG: ArnT family glycosyltransferase [Campylobacterales bacterium]
MKLFLLLGFIVLSRIIAMIFIPLTDTTEARYANTALIMSKLGDWITPYYDYGVAFWGKPPLAFWAEALSFRLLGVYDFVPRLPSLIVSLLVAWLIYRVLLLLSDRWSALLGAVIYSSMLLMFALSGAVITDIYLTFCITLSLVSFLMVINDQKGFWNYLFFAGIGLGILTKGPLAHVIVGGVVFLWLIFSFKSRFAMLDKFEWKSGVLIVLIVSLPWYIIAEFKTPGFLEYFIIGEHIGRFLDSGWSGDRYGYVHNNPLGAIWLMWLVATLPWGVYGGYLLVKSLISKKLNAVDFGIFRDSNIFFLIVWALFVMLFFTISKNVIWTYVAPSLPAFAILLALYIRNLDMQRSRAIFYVSSIVPIVAIVATIYINLFPSSVKTEKFLVEKYRDLAVDSEPIYFINNKSFSATYYLNQEIVPIDTEGLDEISSKNSSFFVAIRKNHSAALDEDSDYSKVFESNRYRLYKKE